jgi:hypothetical protein
MLVEDVLPEAVRATTAERAANLAAWVKNGVTAEQFNAVGHATCCRCWPVERR